jgi:hypothetical protein
MEEDLLQAKLEIFTVPNFLDIACNTHLLLDTALGLPM